MRGRTELPVRSVEAPLTPELDLLIATPCYGGMVSQSYMQSVLGLMVDAAKVELQISICLLGQDALITRSRNTLLAQFMRSNAKHLLFVDADIGFSSDDVFRLIDSTRDIVGGLYPIRAHQWTTTTLERVRRGEPAMTAALDYVGELVEPPGHDGLARARYAGTGFLLISREAVLRMRAAYPETKCRHEHVAGADPSLDVFALFDCLIEPDTKHYLSEDYAFCWRWRAMGGEVWLDTRSQLTHSGMSEFTGNPRVRYDDVSARDPGWT